jgi:hypothetical protein
MTDPWAWVNYSSSHEVIFDRFKSVIAVVDQQSSNHRAFPNPISDRSRRWEWKSYATIIEGLLDRPFQLGKHLDSCVYPNRDQGL